MADDVLSPACAHCGEPVTAAARTYEGVLFCGAACYRKVVIHDHPMTGRRHGCRRCPHKWRAPSYERERSP